MIAYRSVLFSIVLLAGCSPQEKEQSESIDPALSYVLSDVPSTLLSDPLLRAAVGGDVDEVRKQLSTRNFEDVSRVVNQLLAIVVSDSKCSPRVVEELLDAGGDPQTQDDSGSSLLHYAASAGATGCYNILVARGADPTQVTALGNGVVTNGYLSGSASMFERVLSRDDEKNSQDLSMALYASVKKRDWRACQALFSAAAEQTPAIPTIAGAPSTFRPLSAEEIDRCRGEGSRE